jgi:hypothetical protein
MSNTPFNRSLPDLGLGIPIETRRLLADAAREASQTFGH